MSTTEIDRETLPWDIANSGPYVQQRYIEMLEQGVAPKLAEMLATQSPPGAKTSSLAACGKDNFAMFDRMSKPQVESYRRRYKQLTGREPPTSGWYESSIAQFPGDPAAWVKDEGDIKATAKARGLNLADETGETICRNDFSEPEPSKPGLADDIVERLVDEKIAHDPGLSIKPAGELREMVIHEHGPKPKGSA